ncbi:hypothetical protein LCM08_06180 [Salipiger pacificus]|nr:hypothetical protein [Alloyangia pacifica]
MSKLHTLFATDKTVEREGIMIEVAEGIRFRVRRAGGSNKRYGERLSALLKPHKRAVEMGTMDEAVARRLMVQAFVEACLIDWEGVTDADDKPLEFTTENAIALFLELPELFDAVSAQAEKAANFRSLEAEDAAKN